MDALIQHIKSTLETQKFCTVFEKDLSRVFPVLGKELEKRYETIRDFAHECGWEVTITDPGLRATFRPLGASASD